MLKRRSFMQASLGFIIGMPAPAAVAAENRETALPLLSDPPDHEFVLRTQLSPAEWRAVCPPPNRHFFHARMIDGERIKIFYQDFGDLFPLIHESGPVEEAYTSHFFCDRFECYCQTPKSLIESLGWSDEANLFRMNQDMAILETHGVDTSTIEFPEPEGLALENCHQASVDL